MQIAPGSTDRTILVYAKDTLTGLGKTGLVAANINGRYTRVETDNDVTIAAISDSDLSGLTDAHSDGGWLQVDSTNAPGLYRFDIPDAAFAAGAWEVVITIIDSGANNFDIAPTRITLEGEISSMKSTVDTNLNATVSSRLASSSYTAPDNASIAAILVDTGTTLDAALAVVDTVVDAIKVQTDKLTFTVANKLDANVLVVNGVTVTGAGTAGDPWGPV